MTGAYSGWAAVRSRGGRGERRAPGFPALVCAVAVWTAIPLPGHAIRLHRVDAFDLPVSENVPAETWILANTVNIEGSLADDVFALAQDVSVKGSVGNDLWAVGDTVSLEGSVAEHARLAGRTVQVGGLVGSSLAAAGSSVSFSDTAGVGGDAVVVAENAIVRGRVSGNLRVMSYSATLSGMMDGNVRIFAEDIVILPGTEIAWDLVYTSSKDLFLDEKVILHGQLIRRDMQAADAAPAPASVMRHWMMQAFLCTCALVASLPFITLFPQFVGRSVRLVRDAPWKCALAGLLVFSLVPMFAVLAVVVIVGLPLALLLAVAYFLLAYLGKTVVALAVGGMLLRRRGPQRFGAVFAALVLGLFLIYAGASVPGLGWVAMALVLLLGMGGMTIALFAPALPPGMPGSPPLPPGPDSQPPKDEPS